MASLVLRCVCLLAFTVSVTAVWISEDYWTTILYDGRIEPYRSREDFLHFKLVKNYHEVDGYVAYWITNDEYGHYEAFGQAFVAPDGNICGRFVGRSRSHEICGGFRVLSRHKSSYTNPFVFVKSSLANPEDAVTYRGRQVARIWSKQRVASIYGGADLRQRTAYAVELNGTSINVAYNEDPDFYVENVDILTKERDASNYQQLVQSPAQYEEDLPRIYHSNTFDPVPLPDEQTYNALHPEYHARSLRRR
jgi:hypothetical protein